MEGREREHCGQRNREVGPGEQRRIELRARGVSREEKSVWLDIGGRDG